MSQDVKVKVGADTTGLQTGLNSATNSVNAFAGKASLASSVTGKFGAAMTTAGAMGARAFASLQAALGPLLIAFGALAGLKGLADEAGRINDLSQRFGESAESIQKVSYAAEQSGTNLETVAKAMNKAELAAVAAASGNEEITNAFAELGLSAEEFAGLPMEEKLAAIAKGYDENTNKGEALAAMVKLMGKNASELVPLFAQGGDAVTEMMNAASVASSDSIARIDEVSDRFGGLFATLKSWAFDALGFVIDLVDKMSVGIAAAIAFVSNLTSGIDAAKQAYQDTLEGGLTYLDEKKQERVERKDKVSEANIEATKAETEVEKQAEVKAKTESKTVEDKKPEAEDKSEDYFDTIEKAKEKAHEKRLKKEHDAKVKSAKEAEDKAGDKLSNLKNLDSKNNVNFDSLRKIGGGYANSNYAGISKDELRMNKAVDLAQKQYDELKKITDSLKDKTSFDGITS